MSGTWTRKRRSAQASSSVPAPLARTALLSGGRSQPLHQEPLPLPPAIQQQQLLLSRSTERMFEDAELCGVLSLAGRKLRDFPSHMATKYDISDLVAADLSSNRLAEIPPDVCELRSLESLRVRQNALRRVPSNIALLQSLTFLDLSNNHLSQLPLSLFELPLEILLLTGNRLAILPREIRQLSATLTELDLSHNKLQSIPADIALLKMLRVLSLRKNLLDQFPSELCRLSLYSLDLSSNQFSHLPLHIRKMKTLVELRIDDNPLVSPPAGIVSKGREHIFKWMDVASGGGQPTSSIRPQHSSNALRALNLGKTGSAVVDETSSCSRKTSAPIERRPRTSRFHTVGGSDSGYASTADEHRLSHELVPTGLDDINEYSVFSPSPDEGIVSSESVSLKSQDSAELSKIVLAADEIAPLKEKTKVEPVLERMPPTRVPPLVPLAVAEDTHTPQRPIGNGNKVAPMSPVKPIVSSLDLSNNNTVKAKDAYMARPTAPPPGIPTPTTTSKPISKVAPLISTNPRVSQTSAVKVTPAQPTKVAPVQGVKADVAPSGKTVQTSSKMIAPSSTPVVAPTRSSNSVSSSRSTSIAPSARPSTTVVRKPTATTASSAMTTSTSKSRLPSSTQSVRPSTSTTSLQQKSTSIKSDSKASTPSEHNSDALNGNVMRKTSATKAASTEATSSQGGVAIDSMRRIFHDRMGLTLSSSRDGISTELADGVHLCGLVNALRQRTITSIMTPAEAPVSPMKAKRNVDNFVAACKRLNVPESSICPSADILSKRNLATLAKTVSCLHRLAPCQKPPMAVSMADSRLVTHV